jgi:nitrogen-specific signal transduction histidine kinase
LTTGIPEKGSLSDQEGSITAVSGNRSIGILRANLSEESEGRGETIWIVRDTTEQKRLACEREAARRSLALAEIATVLVHEIRNPLGGVGYQIGGGAPAASRSVAVAGVLST